MGGRSSEHDISVASARSVLESLDPERYEVVSVAIGREGRWQLASGSEPLTSGGAAETLPVPAQSGAMEALGAVDVAMPILHGPFGEDGTVQGVLELADVPYVGPGVLASALCMDKVTFKDLMGHAGVPQVDYAGLREGDDRSELERLGLPVFVKPSRLGSSVGISKVESAGALDTAVALARRHDEKVLVEEFVRGIEVEVGVLGNLPAPQASLPGQIVSHFADWYDWSSKYDEGGSDLLIPAPTLSDEQNARAQELAVRAFVATECEGMARADFFVREDGEVVMNELNTIPGFTATSFYARLFGASGIPYDELLTRLIDLALERHERRRGLEF